MRTEPNIEIIIFGVLDLDLECPFVPATDHVNPCITEFFNRLGTLLKSMKETRVHHNQNRLHLVPVE